LNRRPLTPDPSPPEYRGRAENAAKPQPGEIKRKSKMRIKSMKRIRRKMKSRIRTRRGEIPTPNPTLALNLLPNLTLHLSPSPLPNLSATSPVRG
jgi:hypothetical protein